MLETNHLLLHVSQALLLGRQILVLLLHLGHLAILRLDSASERVARLFKAGECLFLAPNFFEPDTA